MDFLSSQEVAVRLGVTQRQVQRLARQRRIPFVRSGRTIRVPVAAWESFLAEQTRFALSMIHGSDERPKEVV